MALKHTLVWTALPNGIDTSFRTKRLKIAVFATIRLESSTPNTPQVLDDYHDALLDWPGTNILFRVTFTDGSTTVTPTPTDDGSYDTARWQQLFVAATPVKPFVFQDLSLEKIHAYPVANIVDFLKKQYVKFATASPGDFPLANDLLKGDAYQPIGFYDRQSGDKAEKSLIAELDNLLSSQKAIPPAAPNPQKDFLQAKIFYAPSDSDKLKPKSFFVPPQYNFHEMLSALGEYPQVMRTIGIIHDISVPVTGVPAMGTVQVRAFWGGAPGQQPIDNRSPRTRYVLTADDFRARSVSGRHVGGRLNLALPEYSVVTVDTDGGALKSLDFANTLKRSKVIRSASTPNRYALPSLRTAGLAVAHKGRAKALHDKFVLFKAKNDAFGTSTDPFLEFEDLIRGYAVDIWDDLVAEWFSLVRREGAYAFTRPDPDDVLSSLGEDEAWVTGGVAKKLDESDDDLHTTEYMGASWTGWSLAVPRPGPRMGLDGNPVDTHETADTGLKLLASFDVPAKSLPRLRYGRTYRMRLRAIDLAGDRVPMTPGFSQATNPVLFGRFEPVQQPFVLLHDKATLGEAAERVVIRTDNTAAGASLDTPQSQRHLAPPRVSQDEAEKHGMFDTDPDKRLAKSAYNLIADHDDGILGGTQDAANKNTYYYNTTDLEFAYLPDPMSRGMAFLWLDGEKAGNIVRMPFPAKAGMSWPDLHALRLVLTGAAATSATPNPAERVLDVKLPPGHMVHAAISSYLDAGTSVSSPGDLAANAIWDWLKQDAGSDAAKLAKLEAIRKLTTGGRFWPVDPWRNITLVHAVPRPIIDPTWKALTATRGLGWTYWTFSEKTDIDGHSTAKMTMEAEWQEPIDALDEPKWKYIHAKSQPFEVPIKYTDTVLQLRTERHDLDTKYRFVTYRNTYGGRYPDCFPAGTPSTKTSAPKSLHIPNSARPAAPLVLYVVPTFGWQRTNAGGNIQSVRKGNGLRVYMDRPWFSSGDGEQIGVVIWPKTATAKTIPSRFTPYATSWGQDPIFKSSATKQLPTLPDFPDRTPESTSGLTLDELSGTDKVQVAGHKVFFDEDRGLWYCDITINAGPSYFPFVRLALARFQPRSVPNAHLSQVVLSEFVQLTPTRVATVIFQDQFNLKVVVSGISYQSTATYLGPAMVKVQLEAPEPGITDPELRWKPLGSEIVLQPNQAAVTSWVGALKLPGARSANDYRLAIREYEKFPGAANTSVPIPKLRLVYADTIEI